MAVAQAQTHITANLTVGDAVSATFGSNVTAGNMIAVFTWLPTSTTQTVSSITDSLSNTYNLAIGPITQASLAYKCYIYYAYNITGGANTVTATWSASGALKFISIYELSGVSTTDPLIDTTSATGNGTTMAGGDLITTATNSGLLCFGATSTGAETPPTSWTEDEQSNSFWYDSLNSRFPTSSGTYGTTFVAPDPATNWIVIAAAFQEAAGGDAVPVAWAQYRRRHSG